MGRVLVLVIALAVAAYIFTFGARHEADVDLTPVYGFGRYIAPRGCTAINLADPNGRSYKPYSIPKACLAAEVVDLKDAKLERSGQAYTWLRIGNDAVLASCGGHDCEVRSVTKYKFR